MIVEMSQTADADEARALQETLAARFGAVHTVWSATGRLVVCHSAGGDAESGEVARLAGVRRVVASPGPYHLAARALRPAGSRVRVHGVEFGGPGFVVLAGPCAVESTEQLARSAEAVAGAGAALLRGGAYKPRTSPYAFQGLGVEGLRMLGRQRAVSGLGVVSEATQPAEVARVAEHVDMVQIGTRNMQNYALLKEVGRCGRPVLLKRGFAATAEEWLCAAEYIMSEGNPDVVLCERGIRGYGRETRFTLDLAIVPVVKRLSHLPVVVDPSHATGVPELVVPMTLAAAAAGADGVIVDVHADPSAALCDGGQALLPDDFKALMGDLERVLVACGRELERPGGCVPAAPA